MTLDEYKKALENLPPDEFKRFLKEVAGGTQTIEKCVRHYVDHPETERPICHWLGLKTEKEKRTEAAVKSANVAKESAKSAHRSMIAACVAAIGTFIMMLIMLFKNSSQ